MKWLLRFVGTVLAILLVGASVFRSEGWYLGQIWLAQEYLGGDKATHAWGGAIMMLALGAWSCAWRSYKRLAIHVAIVLVGVLLEECSQQFLSRRQFSMIDYAYSAAGICSMALLFAWYRTICTTIAQRRLHYKP